MHYQPSLAENKIELYPGVSLIKSDLDACIAIKGSLEAVKKSIEYIMESPKRKFPIIDWPNALSTWVIKNYIKPKLKQNEKLAINLEKEFSKRTGWRCRTYHDAHKDQAGILFENTLGAGSDVPIFIPYVDPDFAENCHKVCIDKRLCV